MSNDPAPKKGLHPRNRHRGGYDFPALVAASTALGAFVRINPYGHDSIDFSDPEAVKALNRALLQQCYGVRGWDIPPGYLCPPVPGRADYLHHLADLLAADLEGVIPRGGGLRGLDIGVGANGIYPLLGHAEYGWRFLGSDIDPLALAAAQRVLATNEGLAEAIELRLQASPFQIFQGLLKEGETFAFTLCNPPFHTSAQAAQESSRQKWSKLGKPMAQNFGGQSAELWCPGGEEAFVRRMIRESALAPERCLWFSTLIAKAASLPSVQKTLRQAGVRDTRIIDMAQGQKRSRIVAWTFLDAARRRAWWAGITSPLGLGEGLQK